MVQQIRWATLNDTQHGDDQDPQEVQIERCLEKYQRTLRLHQRGKLVEAKKLYDDILANEVMQQSLLTRAPKEENADGSITVSMATPLALLQFLVFKNYASILEDEYKMDPKKPKDLAEKALDHYINALSIDPSARMLWYHAGTLARVIGNMRLAKLAFGNGLVLQGSWNTQGSDAIHPDSIIHATPLDELIFERFSPSQWWCLEGLCETLFEIGDFITCQYYVDVVKRQLGRWAYGDKLLNRIKLAENDPQAMDVQEQVNAMDIDKPTTYMPIQLYLTRTNWSALCRLLLDQYFDIIHEVPVLSVDGKKRPEEPHLARFVNQKVNISLDERTEVAMDEAIENDEAAACHMAVDDEISEENQAKVEENEDIDKHQETEINNTVDLTKTGEQGSNTAGNDEKKNEQKSKSTKTEDDDGRMSQNADNIDHVDEDNNGEEKTVENTNGDDVEGHSHTSQQEERHTEQTSDMQIDQELNNENGASGQVEVTDVKEKIEDKTTETTSDIQIDSQEEISSQNKVQLGEKRTFDQMQEDENKENEGEDEDEEEDEGPEITRSSLRASKRERDKIEHEESTRKRVQHEELELSNKIQQLLAATEVLPSLGRPERWTLPESPETQLRQETFTNWFEAKLSELVGTTTWDLEWSTKGSDSGKKKVANAASNTRRYAVFLESLSLTTKAADPEEIKPEILSFLENVNTNDYGIFDVLCHISMRILRRTLLDKENAIPLTSDLRSTILELVEALGGSFVSKITDCPNELSSDEAANVALYLSEIALDQAIHMILTERQAVENALSASSRRKGGALAVAKDLRLRSEANNTTIKEMLELSEQWTHVFERLIIWKPASQALGSEAPNVAELEPFDIDIVLRYWWLRGKTCQVQEEAKPAISWFQRCLKLCQSFELESRHIVVDLNCQYDTIIDQNSVSLRLKALNMLRFTLDARERYAEEDYEGVVTRLQPLISHSDMSAFAKTLEEQHESLELLAKACKTSYHILFSYSKLGQHDKVWDCRMASLVHFTEALVTHGCSMYVSDKSYSKPQDSQQFVRILGLINNSLNELIKLVNGEYVKDLPPIKSNIIFWNTNLILLQMTSQYMFRHPDFIPLVNNFVNPEAPIHAPSATTKTNGFNVLMIRLWVWISHMIRIFSDNEIQEAEQQNEIQTQLSELLSDVHDDLGEREICGTDKGKFLEQTLHTLRLNKKTISKRSLFQCYYCLYNVNVGTDTDTIEEHYAPPRKMDRKAAGELFDLLVPSIIDKLDRGTQLKNDLKEVIDDVAKEFGDPPMENPLVKLNQNIISSYLSSPIQFQSSLEDFCRRCALNVIDVSATKRHGIPAVYFNIYWIRGKMYQAQIKYRSKVNAEKTMENLEDAVEQYYNHLYLNPSSFSAWYAIGSCYMQLADEELIWSASNIITHKDRIAEYQSKAFHCFMQAIYLGTQQEKTHDGDDADSGHTSDQYKLFNLYNDFGFLLYSMCCPPMNMEAFKTKLERPAMNEDGSKVTIKHREPTQRDGYKLSLIMFSKALMQPMPEQAVWRLFLMIGKCYGKLQRPPAEVLTWYKQSVVRCKPTLGQHGHHEVILEPTYKLCAVLIKYLYRNQIQPSEVAAYLESDKEDADKHETDENVNMNHDDSMATDDNTQVSADDNDHSSVNDHTVHSAAMEDENEHDESASSNKAVMSSHSVAHLKPEEVAAYQLIFDRLAKVRKIDRRRWHHRPIFRHAWMHYYIYRDAEQAKADLMPLFALKSNLKSHISIWKPGFERPGKHFEYAHQYTVFMIELAQVTNDANTLKILCRKLRKNQPVLLYDKEIYGAAYTAYLEVIQNYLHKHHNSQQKQASVIGAIPKNQFERKCDEWLRAIVTTDPKPELLVLLTDLFDIKKLNQGHVSDLNSDELIRQCLIALLFSETSIKQDFLDTMAPKVDGNSFRIIEMDAPMEEVKKNDLEGPKVIPATIFHQATRLYRWPPSQRAKASTTNELNSAPGGAASSEAGQTDSGTTHTAVQTPPTEVPMQVDEPPVRTSLPINDLLLQPNN